MINDANKNASLLECKRYNVIHLQVNIDCIVNYTHQRIAKSFRYPPLKKKKIYLLRMYTRRTTLLLIQCQ